MRKKPVKQLEAAQEVSKNLSNKGNLLVKGLQKIKKVWRLLGPGLITGASDDDPSGIATYSQAGASFGLKTLWTAFITFPLMAAIQEMCGRIGLVTKSGIGAVLKKHYPKKLLYFVAFLSVPAAIINIGANLAGMGAVANLLFPQVPVAVFTFLAAVLIVLSIIFFPYKKLAAVMKYLTVVLLVYIIAPFLVKQDLVQIIQNTFIPQIEFSKEFIGILVAILGTTISPYLFFWEASMEMEEHKAKALEDRKTHQKLDFDKEISNMRKDNAFGMFFSNFIMFFIILTAGSILHKNGVTNISTVEEAASSLKPLAGDFAYLLFAIGVIGTGFLAIPVLAGSCSYLLAETFNWQEGMDKKLTEAKEFYLVIIASVGIGLGMNFLGVNPVQALIYTAVLYGIISPVLIGVILHICNNQKIMGKYKNGWLSNILGFSGLALMSLAILALVVTSL